MWSAPSSPPLSGAAGSSEGEIREGFLCPLCLKDLQSVQQLQSHYEEEHSSEEDRHMVGQIKTLIGRAKRKLLRRDDVDRVDSEQTDFVCSGGMDPSMWERQELGAVRNLRSDFQRWRGARIDHYVIEVNKLLIRLQKLTSFDRATTEPAKRKAVERSVVMWVTDRDVPCCPDCGVSFTLRVRRHHCRLCGSIMCRRCTHTLPVCFAQKLTKAVRVSVSGVNAVSVGLEPGRRPSVSSTSSLLEDRDDDGILSCQHCKGILEQQERRLDERESSPVITQLYTKLHTCMESVEKIAPDYVKMAESLNAGENTYELESAANTRVELMRLYERIDLLSKRIASLGLSDVPPPHPKTVQLQKMIRLSTTQFLQEKLLGLTSLPTAERFEELKATRAEKEAQRWRESQGQSPAVRPSQQEVSRDSGWLASSSSVARDLGHPLLEQMANIECFLAQARSAGRLCEARTLEENLRQLQDEWDRMQEEETRKKPEAYSFEVGSGKPEAYSFEVRSGKPEAYSFEVGSEKPEAYSFEEVSVEEKRSRRKPEPYQASPFNGVSQTRGCLNPFEEETVGPNPFEERSRRSPRACLSGEKSEGPNPFEEVVVVGEAPGNPFEEQEGSPGGGGNPFEVEEEEIEEELLRQQIDNIKAYVFDAKQAGRLDEVASLMDNLAELRQALDGAQKRRRAL